MSKPTTAPGARAGLAILALAAGGFAIGTTEFVTMGVLPQIARGLSVTEPIAAHGITAYAVGVIIGVPLLSILGARRPRKGFLIALIGAYALFNLLTVVAPSADTFVAARFLAGLPHGAFFGIATLVAADMVPPERRGRAVALVLMGLTVANVVGVPAAAWLGQAAGWRVSYAACAMLAAIAALMIAAFVVRRPAPAQAGEGGEARRFFSNGQVWFTLIAGAIGLGGTFAIYSYISTTVTEVAGLPAGVVPLFLLAFGVGLTAGVWVGGELASWSVYKTLLISIMTTATFMLLFWLAAPHGWWALPGVLLVSAAGAVTVTSLQLRLMDVAGAAATLGAGMTQAALNVGNALGATAGGVVITAGFGYRAPALVAVGLAVLGVLVVLLSGALDRRRQTPPDQPDQPAKARVAVHA
jgi:DHA1 family inner membrane transport protein